MRRLSKLMCKVLTLLGVTSIILIILFNKVYKKTTTDEFITIVKENFVEVAPSSKNSSKQLLNLKDFEFLIENNLCYRFKKELLAIILVTSYVGHDELRAAHRQAISQNKLSELGIQRIFLLASISQREHFINQAQVQNENQRFGDLLQGNFQEGYRNLSYKHIMGLQWSATQCRKAKFIIKIDDDIVYDIFRVKYYLDSLELKNPNITSSEILAGFILDSKAVIRNQANKWYVSKLEYDGKVYPSYLSGWLYITNPKTALRLVHQSSNSTIFWIDDTWVTGILRKELSIPLLSLNPWFSPNPEFIKCCVRDFKFSNLECEFYVGPNGGNSKLIIEFIHNVEKCYYDECVKRSKEQSLQNTCVGKYENFLPEHGEAIVKPIKLR